LHKIFDTVIDSFIENKIGIAEDFLDKELAAGLKKNLLSLYTGSQLKPARTGNAVIPLQDKTVRSDIIYWLDRTHENAAEEAFFDLMDRFVAYLNSSCFTGITGYEFHYTMYEKGSFYKKHLDQFRNNESRQFSMIMYLNEDWLEKDGGELRIHPMGKPSETISPLYGKSVFFRSNELEHEVLISNKERMSITGWLKIG